MTWRELKRKINLMSKRQKDSDIAIYIKEQDEFFQTVVDISIDCSGVLEKYQPYLTLQTQIEEEEDC
jgi:hypothetical protein